MSDLDYYELIGVDKTATLHEIRSKFRAKVLAEHPDKGGDPKKFQLLNKAYNVLTDQEKRRRYDATGRAEKSAEEEFVEGFGGGRLHFEPRSKDQDAGAIVSLQDRIIAGPQTHEEGFAEWLRQRDQNSMVLTDKDFMKTHLFNAAELATKIHFQGPVQHVLGSPKTDAYGQAVGGAVAVQCKPRPLKKTIDHDEVLVRMLATPVDESLVYASLAKSGVCLGSTGVGRVEQVGTRVEDLKPEDAVLILPKPQKFASDKPIGTARTLLVCNEEDVMRIPSEILEELTPEQICLSPNIVAAYVILETYSAKLKPGDSVLLNGAHLSSNGSSLLQLCKLLKLKPLCLLMLPGAPKNLVKGEHGSKSAWQDQDTRANSPPIRAQYERISEWLVTMGAEEVFPDAVALLRWRDRNQRMLPKLALDGLATKESCEQLMHCLQTGDKDAQIVVYGHGVAQPLQIPPPLLAQWGGRIVGFNVARWVHALSSNAKRMMALMENITKLIRANKFSVETVLYKVGEDAITDAFQRADDHTESTQVVLIFPTLEEERMNSHEMQRQEQEKLEEQRKAEAQKKMEEEEREKLKNEWLTLLFTDQSVAAMSPEGPAPVSMEAGNMTSPQSLIVWVGDSPQSEDPLIKKLAEIHGPKSGILSLAWSQHPAAESYVEFNLKSPEVIDGSWYLRDRSNFENQDLDMLHDAELLGRSMVDALQTRLAEFGLDFTNVVLTGFGKGAGILLYAALLKLFPQRVPSMILFSPVVMFPSFLAEKMQSGTKAADTPLKMITVWGNRNRSTPGTYRQLLAQTLRKASNVQCTPDTLPDGDHVFESRSFNTLGNVLPLYMPK